MAVPKLADYPPKIDQWCDRIPSEEQAAYPLDQSAGGCDDHADEHNRWIEQLEARRRNPKSPWLYQIESIGIDGNQDYISDSGPEIWGILKARNIQQVLMLGVHTNMCVLGRPFGLRRLASSGMQVALVRDLTDTMYDPRAWPHANHFTGTDLIVDHIERYVCPTISSEQILGGQAFRFSHDRRPQLTIIIADDEYKTEQTLPVFASKHLSQSFRVTYALADSKQRHLIHSMQEVQQADVLLISARRRWLPETDMDLLKQFAASGRPMIGIRTASHAFSVRSKEPDAGLGHWPELDSQVWGGNYTNHYGNNLKHGLELLPTSSHHPIIASLGKDLAIKPGGSLYKTAPLGKGTTPLMKGTMEGQSPEPVAWTFVRQGGGRSFYTSLGHQDDFQQAAFETLLAAGIHWACQLPLPDLQSVQEQNQRFSQGKGKQR
jgi:hypothetical protein